MSNLLVDLWQDFEFDTLDADSLNAHDHYGPAVWTVDNAHGSIDVAGQMQVQGAINSQTDVGTRGFGIDCDFTGGRTSANLNILSGPGLQTHLSLGFYVRMPAGWNDSFKEQDVIRLENLTGVKQIYVKAADNQTGDGTPRLHLHNEVDSYAPGVIVTPGEKYWVTVEYDSDNLVARMRVYDVDNIQVGVEQTRPTTANGVSGIIVGAIIGSTGPFPGKMFIDNLIVDWTAALYPLGPGEPEALPSEDRVITTPGAVDANSYVSVAEADAYFAFRPQAQVATWVAATQTEKENAVVMATELLDASLIWNGSPAGATQVLAWPRSGLTTRNGVVVSNSIIPGELKRATAEFARQLLTGNRLADNSIARQGITDLKAGPVSLSFKDVSTSGVPKVVPDAVLLLLPSAWYTVPDDASEIDIEAL